jgi:hypothetical protein
MLRKTTLFLLTLLLTAGFSFAQTTDMVWDTHGIGFKVPSNFKIETNNSEEFSAGNDELALIIAPIQDETIAEADLAEAVLDMAKELEYSALTDADEIKVDDFVGYYIEGQKDGVHAVVLALLDTESSTNLLMVLTYTDDTRDEAIRIVQSFYAYD